MAVLKRVGRRHCFGGRRVFEGALLIGLMCVLSLGCEARGLQSIFGARRPRSGGGVVVDIAELPVSEKIEKTEGASLHWINPRDVDKGPMKIVFTSWEEIPAAAELQVAVNGGILRVAPKFTVDGPPHGAFFEVEAAPGPGLVRARVFVGQKFMEGVELKGGRLLNIRFADYDEVWPVEREWSESMEMLYSVWISRLFRMPKSTPGGWRPLHQVTRNRERNFLHGSMSWDEDSFKRGGPAAVTMRGDCADVPYLLRAYFAWKMGLPMRFRQCTRGSGRRGPRCYDEKTNLMKDYSDIKDPVARFNAFARTEIVWKVHSGTLRTLPGDEESDLFPIEVNRRHLIPGSVYVDSGGHALVVTHVGDNDITAIDGHLDMSITIRRFSQRRFFPVFPSLETGGFKSFRPVYVKDGVVKTVGNKRLGDRFSVAQYGFDRADDYYSFVESRLFAFPGVFSGEIATAEQTAYSDF